MYFWMYGGAVVPPTMDAMDVERTVTRHADTAWIYLEMGPSGHGKLFQYISKCYNKTFFN